MSNESTKRIISSLVIFPIALFFIIKGTFYYAFFLSIFLLILLAEWIKMNKKKSYKFFGSLFLILSTISAYILREYSLIIFLYVILICIATDTGGYIFGRVFKGPKLIKISPNKTYSGMLGSFILSIIIGYFFINEFTNYFYYHHAISSNHVSSLFLSLIVSSISQFGDLIVSYFKRLNKIKDTGKILPGHGGLLDRVDGMLFSIPFVYLLTLIF